MSLKANGREFNDLDINLTQVLIEEIGQAIE